MLRRSSPRPLVRSLFGACVGLATLGAAGSARAGDADRFTITTVGAPKRHTLCSNIALFDTGLDARVAVVRGRTSAGTIVRNFVDVGLENATVTGCSGKCSAKITKKGGAPNKGFAEFEIDIDNDAPLGNATLVLHYLGGGQGKYKLDIIRDTRVDAVTGGPLASTSDRVTLQGAGLNGVKADNVSVPGPGSLLVAAQSSSALELGLKSRSCSAGPKEITLAIDGAPGCRVIMVNLSVARHASCPSGGGDPGPSDPGKVTVGGSSKPNLLPNLATPVTLIRRIGAVVPTTGGAASKVPSTLCAGLEIDTPTDVDVPALTWGVTGVDAEDLSDAFKVVLIDPSDGDRVLATLNVPDGFPAGTPMLTTEGYAGRPTTLRLVLNPRFQIGTTTETKVGCFTAPGTDPDLDPQKLAVRVDPDDDVDEGSGENDNDLPF